MAGIVEDMPSGEGESALVPPDAQLKLVAPPVDERRADRIRSRPPSSPLHTLHSPLSTLHSPLSTLHSLAVAKVEVVGCMVRGVG